ncbi:MAG: tetratricopeptide repeat protein [Bacteroidia bacterium]|nr:tetratricopeptide repeat protein [Bacteroidia bacterium]MDW8158760.1 tetratricopeptide repeat protein [Bacteroidia bacterium]
MKSSPIKNQLQEKQVTSLKNKSLESILSPKEKNGTILAWLPFERLRTQLILLSLVVFILNANTFYNEYAFDDGIVIHENNYTKQGIAGLWKLLTRDSFEGFLGEEATKLLPGGRYRPLSLMTFAIEVELFGLDPHPSHVVNVILYIITCCITLLLLRNYVFPGAPHTAFIAALIFSIHPIHTEVVANIKGRDEILSWLFLALLLYTLFTATEKKVTYQKILFIVLSGFCYILALLSKETGFTFLAIIPLSLYYFTRLRLSRIIAYTLPFFIVIILYFAMRISFTNFGLKSTAESTEILNDAYLYADTFEKKYTTIIMVLGIYIKLLFWPWPLAYDYSYNQIPYSNFGDPKFWLAFIVQVALLGYSLHSLLKKREKNPIAYGILFYFISISIVSNIFINLGAILGERLLFQPSVGFAIAIAAFLINVLERLPEISFYARRIGLQIGLGLLLIIFGGMTITRNAEWKNNETLFTADVKKCPNSAKTNRAIGRIKMIKAANEKFDSTVRKNYLLEAAQHIQQALKIYPKYIDANVDLGTILFFLERYQEAIQVWEQARNINPIPHNLNRIDPQIASYTFEKGFELMKKPDSANLRVAEMLLSYSAKLQPQHALTWSSLGYVQGRLGKFTEALSSLNKAKELNPKDPSTWNSLGIVHGMQGKLRESVSYLKKSVELAPDQPSLWYDLAFSYLLWGKVDSANFAISKSLELKPNDPSAKALAAQIRAKMK